MRKILDYLLASHRWYRRSSGGTWYLIHDDEVSGMASETDYWSREKSGKVIRTEGPVYHYRCNLQFQILTAFHEVYMKTASIVMFGDSLIQYVQWNELLNRCDVANRGVGQDITAGMVARLPSIIDLKPKMVFILGGANDLEHKIPADLAVENLLAISRELKKNNIDPILHEIPYVARERGTNVNAKIFEFNSLLRARAKGELIRTINLNEYLSQDRFLRPEYALFDGVHINADGYLVWKMLIEQVIG